jgi:hypothetical protein
VSWNLIVGISPLRTAKEHGHSVQTMWRVYSAWMRDAVDSDADAIRYAMERGPDPSLQKAGLSRGTPAIAAPNPPNPASVDSSASASGFLALARTARAIWHSICH